MRPPFDFFTTPGAVGTTLLGTVVVYLVAIPLAVLLFSSFRDTGSRLPFEATAFTLDNYIKVFSSSSTYHLLGNTLSFTAIAMFIGLGLGLVFAWVLNRVAIPMRPLLILFVLMGMATPPITDAIAWSLLASPSIGFFNNVLEDLFGPEYRILNIYSIGGMGFVTGLKLVPTAYLLLSGPVSRLDPSLEEAAIANGLSPLQTLRRITLPLLTPAVLGILILYAIVVLESFEIPAVLGLPGNIFVFGSLIYDASHPHSGLPNYGLISAYATVFLACAAALLFIYGRATARASRFAVITGKGYRPRKADLGRWTYFLVFLILLYFVLAVVLPLLALLWTSLGLIYQPPELASLQFANLKSYRSLLTDGSLIEALTNTAVLCVSAATFATLLGIGVAWLSTRYVGTIHRIPDRLTVITIATPSIVIALALLFFYAWLPLPIYGTIWIIVIGLSTRYMAYTNRTMSAAFIQIHKELEEAAAASGASFFQTMRYVILPLVWPSCMGAWLWVFVHALRDASLSLMLFTVSNDTLAVRLFTWWFEQSRASDAAALAICLALVSAVLSAGIIRISMAENKVG